MRGKVFTLMIFCWLFNTAQAQIGYQQDSLQIKVYTEIDYKGDRPSKINVVKVFCDYCNAKQIEFLSREAWAISYRNRYGYKEKIKSGKAKLAHFIRVSKDDFKKIE